MPDIDYVAMITDEGFTVSLEENPRKAIGNKALVNRFEITFLTNSKTYLLGEESITDGYGGDAEKYINQPKSLNDIQGMATALTLVIDRTTKSILQNQSTITDPKERLIGADLITLEIVGEVVYATIEIIPEEYEKSYPLYYNLPIKGT